MNSTEKPSNPLSESSSGVQGHLQIMQGVIQRMAMNSNSCKAWCITIVSAMLVLITDKDDPKLAWLAFFPSILFLFLDAYYLALEKAFRNSYNDFVRKLHDDQIFVDDLFAVIPKGEMWKHQISAMRSFSVWGFYFGLMILVLLAKEFVL